MSTYYDELGLPPQASTDELQAALDARYNEYRNFANHPAPDKRADAEGNQRRVERMREELLDPAKRAAYDTTVGLSGGGGLADPTAAARPTPPPPKKGTAGSAAGVADLWVCQNCSTPNPEWTPFCLKCRTPLLRQCPECGEMKSLVKTGACGNCGADYATAEKQVALRKEIQILTKQLTAKQAELGTATKQLAAVQSSQPDSSMRRPLRLRFYAFAAGGSILFILFSIFAGDAEGAGICFGSVLLLLGLGAAGESQLREREQKTQEEMSQLAQQIATLNPEVVRIQNELQGKQAALGRLDQ